MLVAYFSAIHYIIFISKFLSMITVDAKFLLPFSKLGGHQGGDQLQQCDTEGQPHLCQGPRQGTQRHRQGER